MPVLRWEGVGQVTPPLDWFLSYVMRSSLVKRFHNITTIREDTVGRHTYSMMWIVYLLTDGKPSASLLLAVLEHDQPEAVLSDVSSAYKWLAPDIKDPMDEAERKVRAIAGTSHLAEWTTPEGYEPVDEKIILKLADRLEAMLFIQHEYRALGNSQLRAVYLRYKSWVEEMIEIFPNSLAPVMANAAKIVAAIDLMYLLNQTTEEDYIRARNR